VIDLTDIDQTHRISELEKRRSRKANELNEKPAMCLDEYRRVNIMNKADKAIVAGFKGFNSDLKCRGFQFKVGKEYTHSGTISLCNSGFHFCENPLSTLGFYGPNGSRFAEVEGSDVSDETADDTKRVAKKLLIVAELSLHHLCQLGAKFILDKVNFKDSKETNTGYQSAATNTGTLSAATNTGTRSAATNTGHQSAATNTGEQSAATNTGYQSAATNTGEEGCAISLGYKGKAKGAVGCWLTLAEWDDEASHRIDVQTKIVDGKTIKADTFYILTNGKFVAVD
jgi:hypothetical protein